jgi:hypothetical protein
VADAAKLDGIIGENGKVVVYGIYFDTDKSIIKTESKPALDEIVKLLNKDINLKLCVVGHTDNTGAQQRELSPTWSRPATTARWRLWQPGFPFCRRQVVVCQLLAVDRNPQSSPGSTQSRYSFTGPPSRRQDSTMDQTAGISAGLGVAHVTGQVAQLTPNAVT